MIPCLKKTRLQDIPIRLTVKEWTRAASSKLEQQQAIKIRCRVFHECHFHLKLCEIFVEGCTTALITALIDNTLSLSGQCKSSVAIQQKSSSISCNNEFFSHWSSHIDSPSFTSFFIIPTLIFFECSSSVTTRRNSTSRVHNLCTLLES